MATVTFSRRSLSAPRLGLTALMVLICLAWLVPLWMLVITAMKSVREYSNELTAWTLPEHPLQIFSNIATAWTTAGIGPGFLASLLYGVVGASIAILFASMGAYALTRLHVRGKFLWFVLVFSGTLFPFQMYLIPLFKLYQTTGLYDTRVGMICFYVAICIPFCLFVMQSFFLTVPREIQEAGRLDGCSDFGILWRLFLPLARGPIAVLFLFQFTWVWNDLTFGLVLSTSDGIRPIMPSLAALQGTFATTGPPISMAAAIVASIPTLVVFLLLGRYFVQGLTLTAGAGRRA
ncbi:MAG: carbohydrate ABC transporter permease [Candidatus Dormibacteraeota bacterium]|nr:carbohydrate ABC transporter permease [Candidatus Dormibacteraeota bacterium]